MLKSVVLFTTASIVALMIGSAHADENFANVEQNGSGNDGLVVQGPGDFNKVGTADDLSPGAASQKGNNNTLTITQTSSRNEVGTSGKGFDQAGNHNRATVEQTSSDNRVGEVQQTDETRSGSAARNTLTVTQGGSGGNSVDSVRQTRTNTANSTPGNSATVTQATDNNSLSMLEQEGRGNTAELVQKGGHGNHAGTISQRGTLNTVSLTFNGAQNGTHDFAPARLDVSGAFAGLDQGNVTQRGRGNKIDSFVVTGSDNAFGFYQDSHVGNGIDGYVAGSRNQFGAYQNGNFAAAHIEITGDLNEIYIHQDGLIVGLDNNASAVVSGDSNGVSIAQYGSFNLGDVSITGAGNLVTTDQNGLNNEGRANIFGSDNVVKLSQKGGFLFGNDASVVIVGDRNLADISQTKSLPGAANSLDLKIYGSNNNPLLPGFTGAAVTGVALAAGLTPGLISQTGADNSITMNVGKSGIPADGNLFAFLQDGISNTIKGSVMGSGNQVVVVQGGNNNFTSFSQNGNFNMIGIDQ